jgi:branched-chain amino acid transport system substrate-binding protein
MKKGLFLSILSFFLTIFIIFSGSFALAAKPIVIGVPTSIGFLEGKESLKAVEMAVDEINAKGGVMVGSVKRLFKIESIDIRDV